jgi:glycosyltransferase involved in cell wall biosynthesis
MTGARVLLVAHYASARLGGEAAIPVELFRRLRDRGAAVWLVTHDSCREELQSALGADAHRIFFVPGLAGFGPLLPLGERLPVAPRALLWSVTQLERQLAMAPVIRRLVEELRIDVVHQPVSVSPTIPSPVRRTGVPVVMGPLNGGMNLPPSFRGRDSRLEALRKASAPLLRTALNRLVPGRREAAVVLVANERTRASLPSGLRGQVRQLSDIGVELDDSFPSPPPDGATLKLCFVGRLVPLKAVDLLLVAFAEASRSVIATLTIVGDGPQRAELEELARSAGIDDRVTFTGWLDPSGCAAALRDCDVFVFPSLQEAGGIVVLEAMAAARPVIAARWGGPAELLDDDSAVLLDVDDPAGFHRGLVTAVEELAADTGRRHRLGAAGRRRVTERYDWNALIGTLLALYDDVSVQATVWASRSRRVSIGDSD